MTREEIKLATTTNINTTYAGEFAGEYISAALLTGDTIANGGIKVKQNIKFRETLKKLAVTNDIIQNRTCDFTPTSTIDLTESFLEPKELQVHLQLCKKDYRSDWEAIAMGVGAHDTLPPLFSKFLLIQVLAQVSLKMEQNIWRGVVGNPGEFDGFETLFAADGDVIDVVGTTITAANVNAEMQKIIDLIPEALLGSPDLKLYVTPSIKRFYISSLSNLDYRQGATQDNKPAQLVFQEVPLFIAPGLSANTMVAAESTNLFFGTGLFNDEQRIALLDQSGTVGSDFVNLIMAFTGAVQHIFGSEVVLYT